MADAWLQFERLRWDGPPPACPRCAVAGRCLLLPDRPGARRVWRCAACRSQFSVLTGTLLERTRVPLPVWQAMVTDVLTGARSARELARRHSITPETARMLLARLNAAGVSRADDADAALRRVLQLPAVDVQRIRRSTPPRRGAHYGATGDHG